MQFIFVFEQVCFFLVFDFLPTLMLLILRSFASENTDQHLIRACHKAEVISKFYLFSILNIPLVGFEAAILELYDHSSNRQRYQGGSYTYFPAFGILLNFSYRDLLCEPSSKTISN